MLLICDNLKGFLSSRPPLTLFLVCLGGFTITLLTLAYQVKIRNIRNPDEKDWNDFLNGFKKVQFCVVHGTDSDYNATGFNLPLSSQEYKDVISNVNSNLIQNLHTSQSSGYVTKDPHEIVSLSIPLWVQVKPTEEFLSIPHTVTHLTTIMNSKQMGFTDDSSDLDFNLTFTLPYAWNKSLCDETNGCTVVKIRTCVNFQAPARLFPNSRYPVSGHCEMINTTGEVENFFRLVSKARSADQHSMIPDCDKMGVTVSHEEDSSLYIMLTNQDRSVINLHLMHTSYFLFVMVITLFCYGLIKGKNAPKSKPIQYSEPSFVFAAPAPSILRSLLKFKLIARLSI